MSQVCMTVATTKIGMMHRLCNIDLSEFDMINIDTEGEYFYLSIHLGEENDLFIQSMFDYDGNFITDGTDILVLDSSLPYVAVESILENNDYEILVLV